MTDTALPPVLQTRTSIFPDNVLATLPDPGTDPDATAVDLGGAIPTTFASAARKFGTAAASALAAFRKAIESKAKADADPLLSAAGRAEKFAAARDAAENVAAQFDFAAAANFAERELPAVYEQLVARELPTEAGPSARLALEHQAVLNMDPVAIVGCIASGDADVARAFATLPRLVRRELIRKMPKLGSMPDAFASAVSFVSPKAARKVEQMGRAVEHVREAARVASMVKARVRAGVWHEDPGRMDLAQAARLIRGQD